MERAAKNIGPGQSRGGRAVRRFLGDLAGKLEALRPGPRSSRRHEGSWWDDADLEGSPGFVRGSARLHPVCTRQGELWEEEKSAVTTPQKSASEVGELFAASEADVLAPSADTAEEPEPQGKAVAFTSRGSYAERTKAEPTARMAPYLKLSGVLQSADREERCFELPRARFQPRLRLGVERRMSIDLIRDVRPPPRSTGLGERLKISGKVAL